jgi:hypothetical protein
MFDTLASNAGKAQSTTRERVTIALLVLIISVLLFAVLYYGVQSVA